MSTASRNNCTTSARNFAAPVTSSCSRCATNRRRYPKRGVRRPESGGSATSSLSTSIGTHDEQKRKSLTLLRGFSANAPPLSSHQPRKYHDISGITAGQPPGIAHQAKQPLHP